MSRVATPSTSASISVLPSSRYKDTPVITQSQSRTREWALWNSDPTFSNTLAYALYQVTESDLGRLDLLAYRFYGSVDHAWIIADANNINNIIADMHVGDLIRIPDPSVVEAFVRRKGRT